MLLQAAAGLMPPDAELVTWDELDRVPPFNEDWEADPAPLTIATLRQAIADADGLLIATPEYNGSIPGQLKNAVDWASRPYGRAVLQGKPAAAELRKVLTCARRRSPRAATSGTATSARPGSCTWRSTPSSPSGPGYSARITTAGP